MAKNKLCCNCFKVNGAYNVCDICSICGGYVKSVDITKEQIEKYNEKHTKWLKIIEKNNKVLYNSINSEE